ncbi:MAG TPA: outer membrane protein transport protein [Gammaproteobacteria bacterium]|nr:outer membrane protein transport protein [Gammaproteobacteria bacterium]
MTNNAKRLVRIAVVSALAAPATALATNGYQLIGVGAYQKGMGGAVTSNPGSAMTAITNPAGMAAVGPRADFSMEAFMPDRSWDFSDYNGTGGKEDSEVSMYGVPALGWTAPTSDGSDMYFGGGMYGTSGMGVDYAKTTFANGTPFGDVDLDGYSQIQFWQMAPTLAWSVNEKLKVGAALNIDYQSVGFQQRMDASGVGGRFMNFNLNRQASAFGYGLTFGMLYDVNDMVTVGASYKSKQNFQDLEYQLRAGDIQNFPDGNGGLVDSQDGTYKMDLDYPQQLAAGITVRPNDRLNVSFDVKWIEWSDTMNELTIDGDFNTGNPMGPSPGATTENAVLEPGWDDQVVYAIGMNYAATDALTLRAGYNYSESPIESEDVFSNLVLPAVTESHLTLGGTYEINNRWDFSFAFMKAFNNDVKGKDDIPTAYDNLGFGSDSRTKIELEEESYSFNIGYRF